VTYRYFIPGHWTLWKISPVEMERYRWTATTWSPPADWTPATYIHITTKTSSCLIPTPSEIWVAEKFTIMQFLPVFNVRDNISKSLILLQFKVEMWTSRDCKLIDTSCTFLGNSDFCHAEELSHPSIPCITTPKQCNKLFPWQNI
jgi:hypothetical protein